MAASPAPTQDHLAPCRSGLNHSSTEYTNERANDANSSGLENSMAGAEGPWGPQTLRSLVVGGRVWGALVPNKKGKITK